MEDRHPDPYKCPPLLEIVAGRGTVKTFSFLRSLGAQLGPRTSHEAARAAALNDDNKRLPIRTAMVQYLVDDLKLDINAMDTEGQLPNHWGTPLCCVSRTAHGGEQVVRFLLDQGADPSIKDCWGIHGALGASKFNHSKSISELLHWCKLRRRIRRKIKGARTSTVTRLLAYKDSSTLSHSIHIYEIIMVTILN